MTPSHEGRRFKTKFGQALKSIRTEKGLTQRILAQRLSGSNSNRRYSASKISQWETGKGILFDLSVVEDMVLTIPLTASQELDLRDAFQQDQADTLDAFRDFKPFGDPADLQDDDMSAIAPPASVGAGTEYSYVVNTHIKVLVDEVYANPDFDPVAVQQATVHLLALRDELLHLEGDNVVLEFESQNAIKRLIQEVCERAPWAREQLFSLFKHPVIAGAIGAGVQRYFFS